MKKKYKKGFVLVEALVAIIFVSAIFVIIYMNFYPLLGEYEKRENYDDIESVYKAFIVKRLFENHTPALSRNTINTILSDLDKPYIDINGNGWRLDKDVNKIKSNLNIDQAIITDFNIQNLQIALDNNENLFKNDPDFREYIYYINSYSNTKKEKDDKIAYRLIVKFKNNYKEFKSDTEDQVYYTYANLEVDINEDK